MFACPNPVRHNLRCHAKACFRNIDRRCVSCTRSDGKLFNLSCLKAKTKVRETVFRNMLFAGDSALATHSEQHLQSLMDRLPATTKKVRHDYQHQEDKRDGPGY
ncbi:hypothetical protein HOLleu_06355 [Holothuria leucospilota]|uniref:Uncharacterized protein n=1 Tax=Holothuria leucospilota TaxID=206669 RepID=A0A9Q1HJI2_HOLLE|nr:hypothetical protein HOLleu_06355 [Holothuria leucospilota]